jgi:hypothetical protein
LAEQWEEDKHATMTVNARHLRVILQRAFASVKNVRPTVWIFVQDVQADNIVNRLETAVQTNAL